MRIPLDDPPRFLAVRELENDCCITQRNRLRLTVYYILRFSCNWFTKLLILFLRGLGSEFADYRTRLLRKLDQEENITLKDLTAECQLIKSYKDDARLLEGTPAVNVVRRQKFQLGEKRKPQRRQRDGSSLKAIPYRSGKSTFKPRAPSSTDRYSRNRHIHRIIATLQKDDHPQVEVTISGRRLQLLLDTSAEVALISEFNWNILGKPTLQQTHLTAYAANGTPLKIHGSFDTDFTINCSSGTQCVGQGTCFVTKENCNVFGMTWIIQLPDLYHAVRRWHLFDHFDFGWIWPASVFSTR